MNMAFIALYVQVGMKILKSINIIKYVLVISLVLIFLSGCDDYKVTEGNIIVDKSAINVEVISNDVPITEEVRDDSYEAAGEEEPTSEDSEELSELDKIQEESLEEEEPETELDTSEEALIEEVDETDEMVESVDIVASTPGSVTAVAFNEGWTYANYSMIHSGSGMLYSASNNRKNIVIAVNAGHGTKGGTSVKTYCHPDMSPKVTGGSTQAGAIQAIAVSSGMTMHDGTREAQVTLRMAQLLRDTLLNLGYDVLMIRDGDDVQLDNVARTVMANNVASCHIALHWDGDGLDYDKGCFYVSTPDGIKGMEPVSYTWQKSEALGQSLIAGLKGSGCKIYKNGSMAIDLTQTSYSTIPSVDIELGNAASQHGDDALMVLAKGLADGIDTYFN